jgi:hypothetical protein
MDVDAEIGFHRVVLIYLYFTKWFGVSVGESQSLTSFRSSSVNCPLIFEGERNVIISTYFIARPL